MRTALDQAAERLRDAGIAVEEAKTLHDTADITWRHSNVTVYEFGETHRERYAKYGAMFGPQSA